MQTSPIPTIDQARAEVVEELALEKIRKAEEAAETARQNAQAMADAKERRAAEEAALASAHEADRALLATARAFGTALASAYREHAPALAEAVANVEAADRRIERRPLTPRAWDASIEVARALRAALDPGERRALIGIVTSNL